MFSSVVFPALVLASLVSAKQCVNTTVPVTISARTGIFNIAVPQTNLDAITFAQNLTQQGRNFTNDVLTGYATTSGTYDISTEFCMPDSSSSTMPTVQVLTHGIGFDKTYWDLSYDNFNYSYVDVATEAGYCTLNYDRLGLGNSSHISDSQDTLDELQAFLEVQSLAALTMMLRNGTLPGTNGTSFSKVVHVGHSFGSAQTYALVDMYPTISDGIVLTGFSMNSSFTGFFVAGSNFMQANSNQPLRFGNISGAVIETVLDMVSLTDLTAGFDFGSIVPGQNLPNGYLVSSNEGANQYLFLLPGFFDPNILTVAELTKQPVTTGELLTLGSASPMNNFAGPVLVLTGSNDVPYCGGNCLATGNPSLASIPAAVAMSFPNVGVSNFTAYIQPNTAHGINLHYNATGAYDVIQTFLASKGLASS
ncbi:hypothetical protein MMC17_008975 [Xylographa soralifera]|nr:hypothetical protein [Xylographa soralifera]